MFLFEIQPISTKEEIDNHFIIFKLQNYSCFIIFYYLALQNIGYKCKAAHSYEPIKADLVEM